MHRGKFHINIIYYCVFAFVSTGTAFTVVWEKVSLQDHHEDGSFTFSVSLYKTGDITFAYQSVPISTEKIVDDKHPVKIGLSDAYIIDNTIFCMSKFTYCVERSQFKLLFSLFIDFSCASKNHLRIPSNQFQQSGHQKSHIN